MLSVGVTFPQNEIGNDPLVIRDYAQAVESMGYAFLLAYDHVLGANPERPGGWTGVYNHKNAFHEPFVLYGYLAGLTKRLELITGVIILPQRQTALVAKQAAEVDVLSGGRLRLGVGIGWNAVEYTALGEDFHTRGRRIEEQIDVMRRLWTNDLVTFKGRWHSIPDAGLNPLPVRRPIPIWMGGGGRGEAGGDAVVARVARIADGWIIFGTAEAMAPRIALLHKEMEKAGRPAKQVGIMGGTALRGSDVGAWASAVRAWEQAGAGEVTINTMGAGFAAVDDHVRALRQLKAEIG